jgi:hypothetical protein
MPHASYRVHRVAWLFWRWEADHRGRASRRGYALSRLSARWAARSWLRSQADCVSR